MMLSACAAPVGGISDEPSRFLQELPESVMAIAAPYQNLRAVVLQPEDGCYWYEHVGPVETTMLPLRTAEGRPICTATENRPAQPAERTKNGQLPQFADGQTLISAAVTYINAIPPRKPPRTAGE